MDYHGPETSDPGELVKSKLRVEMGDQRTKMNSLEEEREIKSDL